MIGSPNFDPQELSIGAVIVNFNGGEKVLHSLRALRQQVPRLDEIVVVDNGSADGSIEAIVRQFPSVERIELGENRGLPFARNAGLKRLSTKLALSLDSDIYLEPDCLGEMIRAFVDYRPILVCPRIVLLPDQDTVQCDGASIHFLGALALRHAYSPQKDLPIESVSVGGCIGACMLFDREVILAAGGFDELFFFYHEDLEFSLKLRSLGHQLWFQPSAVVLHDRGKGYTGLSFRGQGDYPKRRAYLLMRHRWLVILIHYRLRTIAVISPALILYETATLGFSFVRGWTLAWGRSWWWLMGHAREIRERRERVQRGRVVADRDLLHGGSIPFTPGLTRSRMGRLLACLISTVTNAYWTLTRRLAG